MLPATAQISSGAAQLSLRVQLEPKDIIELMTSLSAEKANELFNHPKFKDFAHKHNRVYVSRDVLDEYELDDKDTVAGSETFTPTASTTASCIGEDHRSFIVSEHPHNPARTDTVDRKSLLASKLNNMDLFKMVAYAYPQGWKDHWDNAKRGVDRAPLKPLQHIYMHHVDSRHYPELADIVALLKRDEHSQQYSVYELTEVLRAWGFKTPSNAARYQGSL